MIKDTGNLNILEPMINAILLKHHYTIKPISCGGYQVENDKLCIIAIKNTFESAIEAAHMDALTNQVTSRIEAEKESVRKRI